MQLFSYKVLHNFQCCLGSILQLIVDYVLVVIAASILHMF